MVWSVSCRRWKSITRRRAKWCADRDLAECLALAQPRHTPLQQGLHHLGLQHAEIRQTGAVVISYTFRATPCEACPYETDPSFDFEPEVSALVGNATQVSGITTGSSAYTISG